MIKAKNREPNPYNEWCKFCGRPPLTVTRGIPSYATCAEGHRWDRDTSLRSGPKWADHKPVPADAPTIDEAGGGEACPVPPRSGGWRPGLAPAGDPA